MVSPLSFTLRQLQYVVAVADQRSFRRAAEACNVAQPSLSSQIAQVEDLLAIQLFDRSKRRVLVTSEGMQFIDDARALLLAARSLEESAKQHKDPMSRTVRIGVIPTIAPYWLPEKASALRAKYPDLHIIWVEDKTPVIAEQLHEGRLDGAVLALEAEFGQVEQTVLATDPFVLACPQDHPFANSKKKVSPDALSGETILFLADGHCVRDQTLSFCADKSAEQAPFFATSLATLAQMVASGLGITLLPEMAIAVENRHGDFVVREFSGKQPFRTIGLVWRPGSYLRPTMQLMAQCLKEKH